MKTNIINKIIVVLAIILSIIGTLAFCQHKEQEAFENGYQRAIEDAVLGEAGGGGGGVRGEGELYNYIF